MRESSPPIDDTSVEAAVREVLRTCDADQLARRLGLRTAEAASTLRANDAALAHLAERLADGCQGLAPEAAKTLTMSLFDGATPAKGSHE